MASTYLTRTFGAETNRKIWTWSAWVKRQNLVSDHQNALFAVYENTSNRSVFRFSAHQLNFQDTGNSVEIKTNRLFRDTSAWYHIVARVDTTQATSSDRVRIYVNGEQETSFATANYPNQNANMMFNNSFIHFINARQDGSIGSIADMSYSHIHFADGQSYAPTVFGSTDATTGEWKINTSPSVTYGNNGFFILKDGNSVTDQSGNSNNWTVGAGTLTKTEDNPSNVFATYNPLCVQVGIANEPIFANGNTSISGATTGGVLFHAPSTIGVSSGKWYAEFKGGSASNQNGLVGVTYNPGEDARLDVYPGHQTHSYGYHVNGNTYTGDSASSYGNTWTTDIIGVALDLDNHKLYFSKNGTWQNSGDPTSGSTGTGSAYNLTTGETYFFATGDGNRTYINPFDANFGNGYFGTTAVSSAGTNASGIGIFEYDVPTGFTALSTKGLNL